MSVAQARERSALFAERGTGSVAATAPTGVSATDICGSPDRVAPTADGAGGPEPIGGSEFGGRPGGDVDVVSAGSVWLLRPVLQDNQLPGIQQCLGGRAVCQGRPLDSPQSAPALVGHRVAGYRDAAPPGEGLSALAALA